jgi:hypothetical protein
MYECMRRPRRRPALPARTAELSARAGAQVANAGLADHPPRKLLGAPDTTLPELGEEALSPAPLNLSASPQLMIPALV